MFDFLIRTPLINLLLLIYHGLGANLGLSIIVFTVIVRLILLPLTIKQIRQQRKMALLQPKMAELQKKRKNPSEMSAEETALMKQSTAGCLSSILPLLIQLPIFFGLYGVIRTIASAQTGDVFNNKLYFDFLKYPASYRFNTDFFGFDLAGIPSKIGFGTSFIPYAVLIALLVITQYLQSMLMNQAMNNKPKPEPKKKANEKKLTKKEQEKAEMQEEMQKMMQMQTTYLFPVLIGMASFSFPAALGIYWLTQNIFAIIQMYIQYNWKVLKNKLPIASPQTLREAKYEDSVK